MILAEAQLKKPSIELLAEATHKIKGGSGTAGFMDVYAVTASLNEAFKKMLKEGGEIDDNIRNQLAQMKTLLENMKPETSELLQKYI